MPFLATVATSVPGAILTDLAMVVQATRSEDSWGPMSMWFSREVVYAGQPWDRDWFKIPSPAQAACTYVTKVTLEFAQDLEAKLLDPE